MNTDLHLSTDELEAGLEYIRASPVEEGVLEMIVRRPSEDERDVLDEGTLDPVVGLVGDTWIERGSIRTDDGSSHPDMQLNLMNSRTVDLVAHGRDRWPLAGDQLFVDLDLSDASLPAWTKLAIGDAIIQVTDQPHRGCAKFTKRFGLEAHRFVNSPVGQELHLRGINARVVESGTIRSGDRITRI